MYSFPLSTFSFRSLINNHMLVDQVGYAHFGKFDGFEIRKLEGAFTPFAKPAMQHVLTQALQLRLENLRLYAGEEIWGFALINHQKDQFRCFTRYQYALDRYKRDGYEANCLAIKNGTLPAKRIYEFLHSHTQTHTSFYVPQSWEQEVRPAPPTSYQIQKLPAFIPLGSNTAQEVQQFFTDMIRMTVNPYAYWLASSSESTLHTLEPGSFQIISPKAVSIPSPTEKKPYGDSYSSQHSSLSNAYEWDAEDRWKKTEPQKTEKSLLKKWFKWS